MNDSVSTKFCQNNNNSNNNNNDDEGSETIKNQTVLSVYDKTGSGYSSQTISSQKLRDSSQRNYVSTGSSNNSKLRTSPSSQSSLKKEDLVSSIDKFKKCDHRLKLFLSISVYQHDDEEFVCQLRVSYVM